jgi:hypothetical protein
MIDFDEKSKDIEYQQWKEKNGEFVERLTKEVFDKYAKKIIEKSVKDYLLQINPKDFLYSNLYNDIQEMVRAMVGYYNQGNTSKTIYKSYDSYDKDHREDWFL